MNRLARAATASNALGIVVIGVVLVVPAFTEDFSLINALTRAGIFAMFAASWDILSGYSGQENFGHAAFIGTAGFTVGLFTKYSDVGFELRIVLAMAVAAALGLLIGIPCLRLRGPYLALATLVAAAALFRLAFVFKSRTGGEEGISGIESLIDTSAGAIGEGLGRVFVPGYQNANGLNQISIVNYYTVGFLALVMIIGLLALGKSRIGLVLRSIQQDETAAEASGVHTTRYKLGAFVLSATLAGFAGSIWAYTRTSVSTDMLTIDLSLLIIVMAILGGAGSVIGPAAGAYLVVLLDDYYLDRLGLFAEGSQGKNMLFSGLLIAILIVQPRGLIAPIVRKLGTIRLIPERPRV